MQMSYANYRKHLSEMSYIKKRLINTVKEKKEHFNAYHVLLRKEQKLRQELFKLIPNEV